MVVGLFKMGIVTVVLIIYFIYFLIYYLIEDLKLTYNLFVIFWFFLFVWFFTNFRFILCFLLAYLELILVRLDAVLFFYLLTNFYLLIGLGFYIKAQCDVIVI